MGNIETNEVERKRGCHFCSLNSIHEVFHCLVFQMNVKHCKELYNSTNLIISDRKLYAGSRLALMIRSVPCSLFVMKSLLLTSAVSLRFPKRTQIFVQASTTLRSDRSAALLSETDEQDIDLVPQSQRNPFFQLFLRLFGTFCRAACPSEAVGYPVNMSIHSYRDIRKNAHA